jgi:prepilin-type processing-associated H-X9-DG protein
LDGGKWTGHNDGSATHWDPRIYGFHWDNYDPADWYTYKINANKGLSPNQVSNDWAYARPSANHPGLVNAYFCDGHLAPVRDDIDYRVYVALMTAHGLTCTDSTGNSPDNVWGRQWLLDDNQY